MNSTDTLPGSVHHEDPAFPIRDEKAVVGGLEDIFQFT
jgi:hypothetical protein